MNRTLLVCAVACPADGTFGQLVNIKLATDFHFLSSVWEEEWMQMLAWNCCVAALQSHTDWLYVSYL